MIKTTLVDKRNYYSILPQIVNELRQDPPPAYLGLDIETHDADRHDGLNEFMSVNDDGHKAGNRPLVFDVNRTTLCGLSIYVDGSDTAYYFNIGHADVHNRLDWDQVESVLSARQPKTRVIAHNLAFELVMLKQTVGYDLPEDALCSLQLCVSAYNPDTYDPAKFIHANFDPLFPILKEARTLFNGWEPGKELSTEQVDLMSKVVGKQSSAAWSYNGIADSISYGYGLKKAVKSWFDYDMTTFEQALRGHPHMGCLTGDEVKEYGADDAYWCVRLFKKVADWLIKQNPKAFVAFLKQEMPCVPIFAEQQRVGIRIDRNAVFAARERERHNTAGVLRELRAAIRQLLPFPAEPHQGMLDKGEAWYVKHYQRKRTELAAWSALPDTTDDFEEVSRVAGSVSAAWVGEKQKGLNLTYYHTVRVIFFDLLQTKVTTSKGKVCSDAKARGRLIERFKKEGSPTKVLVLDLLGKLAGIEQRMKLFLTPYTQLIDPDTGRVHPTISARLATRRMSMQMPNGQQISKRGESTFIRSFYLADDDDSVLVSLDWSAIELVIIGELSKDAEFRKAYGQLPHADLHATAAAGVLGVSLEDFKGLRSLPDSYAEPMANGVALTTPLGDRLTPAKAYKWYRNVIGKGANFEIFYSGLLMTVMETMGWSLERMREATDNYASTFPEAWTWRQTVIESAKTHGYVELPDGHRRYRFESTPQWLSMWKTKARFPGAESFINECGRKIQRRSYNQVVNAMVQGTAGTLMKRSLIRLVDESRNKPFRVIMTIHDEIVASVRRDYVLDYIRLAKNIMRDHDDMFPTLKLDCSASVGRNFEPFHEKKAPFGQIELDEASHVPVLPESRWEQKLTEDEIVKVVDYLFGGCDV